INANAPLSAFLDQMKGARIDVKVGSETVSGIVLSARNVRAADKDGSTERETAALLTDTGAIRTVDLSAAGELRFADPKLQGQLRDYLSLISQSRSKEQRSVYIDATGSGTRDLSASYLAPAPAWKSSYRLLLGAQNEANLEGWAIIDNATGEDWNNVRLAV